MDDLMQEIHSGAFFYDRPFATENSLMTRYGVSRITARRALSELEKHGILYRKRGSGSFVSRDMYEKSDLKPDSAPLPRGGKGQFAFVLPFNVCRTGLTDAFKAASEYLNERGWDAAIYISDEHGEDQGRAILSRLTKTGVAGVAYYPGSSNIHLEMLNHLMLSGKPAVVMDIPSPCRHVASVSSDNFGGMLALMRHLTGLGHRRIAFLAGIDPPLRATLLDRFSAYMLGLKVDGVVHEPLVYVDMTPASLALPPADNRSLPAVLKSFLAQGITAVVCGNDELAHRVLEACRDMDLAVPGELSVAGFDDSEWATIMPGKRLTTVAQDMPAIGRAVARALCECMGDALAEREPVVVPTALVIGNTTGKPREK